MKNFRNVAVTINNYTDADITRIKDAYPTEIQYLILGRECAPTTGTPHLQCYIEFHNKITLVRLKRIIPNGHIAERIATQQQNIDYCKKDGDFEELGTPKASGRPKRGNALQTYADAIEAGSLATVLSDPDLTYNEFRFIRDALTILEKPRDPSLPPPTVKWFYGPTGTGKSHTARIECSSVADTVYVKSDNSPWFDGYDGHQCVILEDFRSADYKYNYVLKLLDRYEHRVPVKGGYRQWKPSLIIITSPFHPKDTYQAMQERNPDDSIEQLLRRITEIRHFPVPYSHPYAAKD